MDESLRRLVIERADGRCEYCHFPNRHAFNPFQIDHIIAQKHGGPTTADNLAWSCLDCNAFKGPNIAGWIDSTGSIVRLFHPRKDRWGDHFHWQGPLLVAQTDVAVATIKVLDINDSDAIEVRRLLLDFGETLG